MPRPCHASHPLSPETCPACKWCILDTPQARDYRTLWQEPEPGVLGIPNTSRCPFLSRRARNPDGTVKTRECGPCGGKALDLFQCRCPEQPMGAEVTLLDCGRCPVPRGEKVEARKLILKCHLSPGDVLTMTAAIHSLHKANPGKFRIAVDTTCPAIWESNPEVEPLDKAQAESWERMDMHYPSVNRCGQEPISMLGGYAEFLADNLQVKCPLCINRPLVYLSKEEEGWQNQVSEHKGYGGKFWLINAGVKQDYTAKQYAGYQEVVDRLQGRIMFVQVGKTEHLHKPLRGVIDMLGQTDDRQLIRLAYHAQGILCGVTYLMHLAAALQKPAVILAGAREPRSWNCYPQQVLLSTVGMLPCAKDAGCWRSRVVKLGDGAEQDNSLCENPVFTTPPSPRCMAIISPEQVVNAVDGFYAGGVLSR